mmetsp:Transcript_4779/g.4029  ORF Transcript_4779/g.4029 Transcript_4779/m.4029 type:complete len:266 (+) Transcript_4779:974-1771(+)
MHNEHIYEIRMDQLILSQSDYNKELVLSSDNNSLIPYYIKGWTKTKINESELNPSITQLLDKEGILVLDNTDLSIKIEMKHLRTGELLDTLNIKELRSITYNICIYTFEIKSLKQLQSIIKKYTVKNMHLKLEIYESGNFYEFLNLLNYPFKTLKVTWLNESFSRWRKGMNAQEIKNFANKLIPINTQSTRKRSARTPVKAKKLLETIEFKFDESNYMMPKILNGYIFTITTSNPKRSEEKLQKFMKCKTGKTYQDFMNNHINFF